MKPEIILLLDMGLEPKVVAELLKESIQLVSYYNKQYKTAKEKVNQIIMERANK